MKHTTIAAIGLLLMAGPALAHHPFDTEFDAKAPITINGTVKSLDWRGPHVMIHVDAKDDQGQMKTWDLETASPEEMTTMGWTPTMLKSGDQITVQGYRAKSEPTVVAARTIEIPGGKKMMSAGDDGGPKA